MVDLTNPPAKFWHCGVKLEGRQRHTVANDLTFDELDRTIVQPWLANSPFPVAGALVNPSSNVAEIRIAYTQFPQSHYANEHNTRMRARGIGDGVTNRKMLPLEKGEDATYDLLFSGRNKMAPEPDVEMVIRICERLPQAAKILGNRARKGKPSFVIADEYDVQDLLQATLRAYLKYSVQEDPLPKVAGAKSSRIDISIADLGVLIEVKYVRRPDDQKRLFEEYSQDLVLYAEWLPLKTLIYLVYNSDDLVDAEALERLNGTQEIGGKRFDVRFILA
jgi:hypothetical protein